MVSVLLRKVLTPSLPLLARKQSPRIAAFKSNERSAAAAAQRSGRLSFSCLLL